MLDSMYDTCMMILRREVANIIHVDHNQQNSKIYRNLQRQLDCFMKDDESPG